MELNNVLSLFNGMGCGKVALDRANIKHNKYYSSEVDKWAIQIDQKNNPNNIQLGDINNWKEWDIDFSSIDLVLAGSPCQGFSFAGKGLAFDDERSKLFFVFIEILEHIQSLNPSVVFLLENVRMKQEYQDVISDLLLIKPELINSALLSAQSRNRLYWFPWAGEWIDDKGLLLSDILEDEPLNTTFMSDKFIKRQQGRKCLVNDTDKKAACLSAMEYVKNGRQGDYIACGSMVGRKINPVTGKRDDYNPDIKTEQRIELRSDDKTGTLTTVQKDNLVTDGVRYRKLTPIECERLQTLPDNYTEGVSNTQRYKMLGNGWTVDVIAHILRELHQYSALSEIYRGEV